MNHREPVIPSGHRIFDVMIDLLKILGMNEQEMKRVERMYSICLIQLKNPIGFKLLLGRCLQCRYQKKIFYKVIMP